MAKGKQWVSTRYNKTGHGLNTTGRNGSGNGPLRKIVRVAPHPERSSLTVDVLECGHFLLPAKDLFGSRAPQKRRCKKCKANRPIECT